MFKKHPILIRLEFLFLAFLSLFLFFILKFSLCKSFANDNSPCLECHNDFKKHAKNVHRPLDMGCDTCHLIEGGEHPKRMVKIKLKQDVPGLCYSCHDESKFKGTDVHSPVAKGKCTSCHDAHQSDFDKLLILAPPELCFSCHDKVKFTRKHIHSVSLNGCGKMCHHAHVSDKPYLLSQPINDVCIGCHKAQERGNHIASLPGARIHPVSGFMRLDNKQSVELNCASCHDPHSSKFAKLFVSGKTCRICHNF